MQEPIAQHGKLLGRAYKLAEVYCLMDWARHAKAFYEHGRADEAALQNPVRRHRSRVTTPGRTEVLFLAQLPRSAEKIVSRVLSWGFRRQERPLVCVLDQWHLAHARGPLVLLGEMSGLASTELHGLLSRTAQQSEFRLRGLDGIYVNPRLANEWMQVCRRFSLWWTRLTVQMSALPDGSSVVRRDALRSRKLLDVVNLLLIAAINDIDAHCFSSLARRWQLPVALLHSEDPELCVESITVYLGSLSEGELGFVAALLLDGFHRSGVQVAREWPQGL